MTRLILALCLAVLPLGLMGSGFSGGGGGTTLTARDNILNNSNNLDWTPNDASTLWLKDEMYAGTATSGLLGELGWYYSTIVAAPSVANTIGTYPNLGVLTMTTAGTSGNGGWFNINDNANGFGAFGDMSTNTNWEINWIFKLASNANIRFRAGLSKFTTSCEPTDGIWLRADTNVAYSDTAFNFVTRAASTNTVATPTGTMTWNTGWNRLKIASTTAGTINFTLYNASGVSQATGTSSTNVPTADMIPSIILCTDTTGTKAVAMDLFTAKFRGMSR